MLVGGTEYRAMANAITGFFQYSDFSTESLVWQDWEDVTRYWMTLDSAKLDAQLQQAQEAGEDWCEWGLGIYLGEDDNIHLVREDLTEDTFTIRRRHQVRRGLMGLLFGTMRDEETVLEGVNRGDAISLVLAILDGTES